MEEQIPFNFELKSREKLSMKNAKIRCNCFAKKRRRRRRKKKKGGQNEEVKG